ncbi:MAG TPA: glycerate kinase, partial [Anaeromyxobacter sp.]
MAHGVGDEEEDAAQPVAGVLGRRRPARRPGAGAAGGLGAGLLAFADAKLRSGAAIVMTATRFDERAARADLIVTGEGRIDAQSAYGKLTGSVISKARAL